MVINIATDLHKPKKGGRRKKNTSMLNMGCMHVNEDGLDFGIHYG